MRRLWLPGLLAFFAQFSGAAFAQKADTHSLAILSPSSVPMESIRSVTLTELAKDGFVEGRNLMVQQRVGSLSQLSRLARELVADHPNAVIAVGGAAIRAVQEASDTIPIVGAFIGEDPIAAGFAKSFARPGGNVTGVVMLAPELDAKRLDLLREAVPHGDIAVLAVDPDRDKPNTAGSRSAQEQTGRHAGQEASRHGPGTQCRQPL